MTMATPHKRTSAARPKPGSAGSKPAARRASGPAASSSSRSTSTSAKPKSGPRPKPGRASEESGERRSSTRTSERSEGDRAAKPRAKKKSSRQKPVHDHAPSPREERDGVRLQKHLASAGVASRRHAEDLIVAGHVAVNGEVVRELGTRVFPERDRVTVRGEPVKAEAKVYYVLNKPDAIVCSAQGSVDERGRPTVLSLMHGIRERLYPVGRLDYHSRGVVLLTNDGELAEALTHPRHGVVKTYHVKFQGKLSDDDEQALREGVELDDGAITRPLTELFAFRETGTNVWYQLGLTEGLNRQIRRMGDAIGHPVLKLIRVAIGDITADGLEEGQHRPLKPTEVAQLLATVRLAPERRRTKPAAAKAPAKPATRAPAKAGAAKAGPGSAARKPSTRSGGPARASRGEAPAGRSSARPSKPRPTKK
jgi:23S rRNA pseudouridine2605 synthase